MEKIEKLTPEQEALMIETGDEWINLFFDNVKNKTGIDKPQFEEGIRWLYCDLMKKPMPKVVYCDSWFGCIMTIDVLKKMNTVGDTVGATVRATVWDTVGDTVGATVGDTVGDTVWNTVWNTVRDTVGATVGDTVRATVGATVWDTVWDTVRATVRATVREYSSYIGISNYGWVSFYNFFEKIGIVKISNFDRYMSLIRSGVFECYEYENMVFAIQPPIYIERKDGRLHSTTRAAVEFRDGYKQYYINGRNIPDWVIEEKETITRDRFLSEKNADIRGGIYEVLGQKGMMDMLGAKIVSSEKIHHRNGDIEKVDLLKTDDIFTEIDNQPFAWVRMICPSTGTNYLQGVEPHHTSARAAIASLSPFSEDEYEFDYRA
jgi:hypothetical protein